MLHNRALVPPDALVISHERAIIAPGGAGLLVLDISLAQLRRLRQRPVGTEYAAYLVECAKHLAQQFVNGVPLGAIGGLSDFRLRLHHLQLLLLIRSAPLAVPLHLGKLLRLQVGLLLLHADHLLLHIQYVLERLPYRLRQIQLRAEQISTPLNRIERRRKRQIQILQELIPRL